VTGTDPVDPALARLLDDPAVWAEVSPGLRERTLAEALGAPPGTGQGHGEATDDGDPRPDDLARHRARRRGWQRPLVLAAAAAIVLLVVVSAAVLRWGGDDPQGVEVALAGTPAAPEASATMRLRDEPAGVAVTLEVDGLPPAPEGTFYEAWLVGDAGKVSAGTFHQRGDQDEITLWLGVDTEGYEALSVTRQPVDGGSLADGEVVLRGELP
jgi:hypothetical protein